MSKNHLLDRLCKTKDLPYIYQGYLGGGLTPPRGGKKLEKTGVFAAPKVPRKFFEKVLENLGKFVNNNAV